MFLQIYLQIFGKHRTLNMTLNLYRIRYPTPSTPESACHVGSKL